MNKAAIRTLKELNQGENARLFLPADMDAILESLKQRKEIRLSREVKIKDRIFDESIYTTPAFDTVRIYANDITWRKQAEEALLTINQRLSLLSDTASQLLISEKPQEIMSRICKKVMEHLDCHVFFNFLADEKMDRLRLNAYAGIPARTAKEIEWVDYRVAACGTVARKRKGTRIIAGNIPENPDLKTDLVRSFGVKAYACQLLLSHHKVIGTLSFGSRTKTAFSDDEIYLMNTVADQVSMAMGRVQARVELEAKVRERTAALAKTLEALQKKIGELKLAKEVLTEQSEQLESFFMHTLTPLVFLDPDFNFIRVNEAYAKSCSRDASEFPGHNHFEFYPDKENEAIFKNVVETKIPYQAAAKPFVFPDHPEWGVTYWDWVLFPALDNKGNVAFLVFSLQEVTERTLAEQAIYESEKKYRSLIENASDGIVIFDRQLNFIDANPMASRISGFSREELLRLNARDLVPADEYDSIPALMDRVLSGETVRQEMSMLGKDGKYVTVEISANLLEGGNIQTIVRDITERKAAEEALMESKTSLSEAERIAHLGNWHWDIKTNILRWSDEMYRIFGMTRRVGVTYDAFLNSIHPNDRGYVNNAVQEALQKRKPYNIDYSIILPDGAIRIIHAQGKVTYSEKGEPIRMFGTVQDITKQKQIEEEIRDSREQLRNLYLHLQSVREEERTHIAREIHDEFGTILTALKIDLSWLERQMPQANTAPAEKIRKDLDLINSAIKTVQRISSELRPGILDHLGLSAAMEWQVKEFCNRSGINWDITIDLGDIKPNRDISTTMFRILQESLTNIARHAEATEVRVSLREKNNVLALEIIDNGKGVSEEQLSDRSSFGLIGMKERAQHLGGNALIKKADGKGTKVLVTIPL